MSEQEIIQKEYDNLPYYDIEVLNFLRGIK